MTPTATQIFKIDPERRILFARLLAALVVVVGDSVLGASWLERSGRFVGFGGGSLTMDWYSALCLVLLGTSVILLPGSGSPRRQRVLPDAVAGIATLDIAAGLVWVGTGLALVISILQGGDLRMPVLSAVCTCLAAISILFLSSLVSSLARLTRGLSLCGLLIAYAAILAYAFNPDVLDRNLVYAGMSLPSAICFMMLFSAICLIDPRPTWLDAVFGKGQGARTARSLAPIVFLGPLVLAIVAVKTTKAGFLDPDLRLILLIAALTFVAAETLSRTAQAENLAQHTLRVRNRLLEQIAEGLPVAIVALDRHGGEVFANSAAQALTQGFDCPASWLLTAEFTRPGADEALRREDRPVERILRGEVLDLERYVVRRSTGERMEVLIASGDRAYPYDAPFVVAVLEDRGVASPPTR